MSHLQKKAQLRCIEHPRAPLERHTNSFLWISGPRNCSGFGSGALHVFGNAGSTSSNSRTQPCDSRPIFNADYFLDPRESSDLVYLSEATVDAPRDLKVPVAALLRSFPRDLAAAVLLLSRFRLQRGRFYPRAWSPLQSH